MHLRGEINGRPFAIDTPTVDEVGATLAFIAVRNSAEVVPLSFRTTVMESQPATARPNLTLADLVARYQPTRPWMCITLTAYSWWLRGHPYCTARALRNTWTAVSPIRWPNFARDVRRATSDGYGYLASRRRYGVPTFAITPAGIEAVESGTAFVARRIRRTRKS